MFFEQWSDSSPKIGCDGILAADLQRALPQTLVLILVIIIVLVIVTSMTTLNIRYIIS